MGLDLNLGGFRTPIQSWLAGEMAGGGDAPGAGLDVVGGFGVVAAADATIFLPTPMAANCGGNRRSRRPIRLP